MFLSRMCVAPGVDMNDDGFDMGGVTRHLEDSPTGRVAEPVLNGPTCVTPDVAGLHPLDPCHIS
jgi:hypothetical protein